MDLINFGLPSLADCLSADDLERLQSIAVRSRFADGQWLHMRGDDNVRMGIVVEGAVRLIRRREDGRHVTQTTWGPGQHFGFLPALAGEPRTHDAIAVGPTVVDQLAAEPLDEVLAERPSIVRALLHVTTRRLALMVDLYDDIRLMPPIVRLAKLLLLARRSTQGGDRIECVQEDLAQMLGLSGVTVGQLLKTLSRLGFVETGYGAVTILEADRLALWAASQNPL